MRNGRHSLVTSAKKLLNPAVVSSTTTTVIPSRKLNVHEHVGLEVLRDAGVNVPRFGVASTPSEAREVASNKLKGLSDYVDMRAIGFSTSERSTRDAKEKRGTWSSKSSRMKEKTHKPENNYCVEKTTNTTKWGQLKWKYGGCRRGWRMQNDLRLPPNRYIPRTYHIFNRLEQQSRLSYKQADESKPEIRNEPEQTRKF